MHEQKEFKAAGLSKKEIPMPNYIFAYDPKIKRRVVHTVKGGMAISLVTGHRFRYNHTGA